MARPKSQSKLLTFLLCLLLLIGCTQPHTLYPVAHRARPFGADNSITAIRSAIAAEVPLVEIDIRLTQDLVPIIFHDARINLGCESVKVNEISYLEIQRSTQSPPPTFNSLIPLLNAEHSRILLDIKGDIAQVLEAALPGISEIPQSSLVILTYSAEENKVVEKLLPQAAIAYRLTGDEQLPALPEKTELVQIDISRASGRFVDGLHQLGYKVLVKVVDGYDDAENWRRMREFGVDYLLTDRATEIR